MTDVVSMTAEVLVPLGKPDAERLDKRLRLMAGTARDNFEKVGRLIDEAKQGRIHDVLGFKSWTAYLADAVGGQLQLSGDSRAAMVSMLAGEGMSVRAIATATGVSKSTVSRDLEQVSHDGTPDAEAPVPQWDTSSSEDASGEIPHFSEEPPDDKTTGLDGKGYTKRKPTPKPKTDMSVVVPRKVVERLAPKFAGMVDALEGLDPNEVDGDAIRDKVDTIRESISKVTDFVDKVLPPKPPEPAEPEQDSGRKPQIPTVLRRNVAQATDLLKEVDRLRLDSRWDKSAERFKVEDRIAVKVAMTLLSNLDKTLGGDGMPAKDEPFDGIEAPAADVEQEAV
jgi:DNA-binding transcriptional ArsR family regulator